MCQWTGRRAAAPSIFSLDWVSRGRPKHMSSHRSRAFGAIVAGVFLLVSIDLHADSRLQRVRDRGVLGCGVSTGLAGFAAVDGQGRYSGLDVDVCRAVAAAIFGSAERVRYVETASVE